MSGFPNPRLPVPVGLGRGILKIAKSRAGSLFRGGNLLFSMPAEFAVKFRLYSLFEETSWRMNEDGLAKARKAVAPAQAGARTA